MSGALMSKNGLANPEFSIDIGLAPSSDESSHHNSDRGNSRSNKGSKWRKPVYPGLKPETSSIPMTTSPEREGNGKPNQGGSEVESFISGPPSPHTKKTRKPSQSQASPPMRITGPRPQRYASKAIPMIDPKFPPTTPNGTNMTRVTNRERKDSGSPNKSTKDDGVLIYGELRIETPVPAPMPWKALHSVSRASSGGHASRLDQPAYNNRPKHHLKDSITK
ncbi:hypothetical protein F4775DRAFT_511833 [Biscogniauxia sp. FL1348]|nr:hypothetical protein F4775DRAFT_511833 [Biscogniauxia sp. FL1348]